MCPKTCLILYLLDGFRVSLQLEFSNEKRFSGSPLQAPILCFPPIKTYKPNLKSYQWACKKLGVEPGEAMMVAAHGWDCAGIKAAGLQSVFVSRPGKAMYLSLIHI